MKTFVTLFCVLMIPLTLASDTQHRFKVCVHVQGDDEAKQEVQIVESHLKRELRLLGDVNVVGYYDDWQYILDIFIMTGKYTDGRQTGWVALGTYQADRLDKFSYRIPDLYHLYRATEDGILGAALYPRDNLPEFCIRQVNDFDKERLEPLR